MDRRARDVLGLWVQNTPLELSKDYKIHEKGGAEKSKQEERKKRQKRPEKNMVTEDRLRCESIGSVFYSSIKSYLS